MRFSSSLMRSWWTALVLMISRFCEMCLRLNCSKFSRMASMLGISMVDERLESMVRAPAL